MYKPDKKEILRQNRINVLDQGHVILVDYMGDDDAVVQAARCSYGEGTKQASDDETLIRYLMRMRHTSVFEQCVLKFHVKAPIFVFRQMHRHRTQSINELSARYSIMQDCFYVPSEDRIQKQSKVNKQGSAEKLDDYEAKKAVERFRDEQEEVYGNYREHVDEDGIARELARINLPLSTYSSMYTTINLHNLLHFLKLRMSSHAQYEIRVYADAMHELVKRVFPVSCQAFDDYVLNAITFSKHEMNLMKDILFSMIDKETLRQKVKKQLVQGEDKYNLGKRELREFRQKLGLLRNK